MYKRQISTCAGTIWKQNYGKNPCKRLSASCIKRLRNSAARYPENTESDVYKRQIQLFVYVVPIVSTVCHAFQNTTIAGEDSFTLTGNFAKIAKDLGPVIGRTLIWTFGSIIPSMLLGLAAALVFNRNFFGKKLCVSICLLPYTIPLIIVAVCWYLLYQPNFGLLNTFMQTVGLTGKPVQFLSRNTALTAVIVARIWRSMPFAFISYYAALKSIPAEYMEAAAVDGAGHFQTLRYITLPQLKPITLTTGIILTV